MLVFLPELSFGANQGPVVKNQAPIVTNPAPLVTNQTPAAINPGKPVFTHDQEKAGFECFKEQGDALKNFEKAHPEVFQEQDEATAKWLAERNVLIKQAKLNGTPMPPNALPPMVPALAAFMHDLHSKKEICFSENVNKQHPL